MAKNQPQIDVGQGGAILIGTDAYTPPTGKVIVAINFMMNSSINSLTPANDTNCRYLSVSADASNANDNAGADGVGAKSIQADQVWFGVDVTSSKVSWIYGRYSAIKLNVGRAIVYLADA